MAEPSSNSSSTIPTADSFFDSLWAESRDFFLNNRALSLFCFFGGVEGCTELSGGIISTTIQVVSSFKPLDLKASCTTIQIKSYKKEFLALIIRANYNKKAQVDNSKFQTTFTTCLAASSAGNPRQDFAASCEDRASQMPSEAIISLPPLFDSFHTNKQYQRSC